LERLWIENLWYNRQHTSVGNHFECSDHPHVLPEVSWTLAHFGRGKMQLRKLFPSGGLENVTQVIIVFQEMKDTFTETVKFDNVQQEGSWVPGWNVKSVQRYLRGSMSCKKIDAETVGDLEKGWVMVVLPRWKPRRNTRASSTRPSAPTAQSSSSHPHITLVNPKYEDAAKPISRAPGPKSKHFSSTGDDRWIAYNGPKHVNYN